MFLKGDALFFFSNLQTSLLTLSYCTVQDFQDCQDQNSFLIPVLQRKISVIIKYDKSSWFCRHTLLYGFFQSQFGKMIHYYNYRIVYSLYVHACICDSALGLFCTCIWRPEVNVKCVSHSLSIFFLFNIYFILIIYGYECAHMSRCPKRTDALDSLELGPLGEQYVLVLKKFVLITCLCACGHIHTQVQLPLQTRAIGSPGYGYQRQL